uniref:Predicted protein n=1 Tax=Physcomitrium patens TaxID=3218 RepID=A9U5C3_PHYPA
MENENKNFEGFLGEVSGGESSKGQGMHMDPSIASLFQAFSLSMQQQQSNDRKEALATKALQAMINKIDQFDGRNISRYLRCYVREMELNRVSEKKMVALFGLATISEIRDHITSITDRCGNSWEDFSHALKDEYFLEDADRVTKKLFLGWIERPNKNLQATELLREFERQYSQLSKVEKLTLEPNKIDLFLQAADGEMQEKLEPLLEDKEEDEGLTTKWKNVEDAVGLLTKKERRKDRSNIPKTVQASKAPGIICWKDAKIALKGREDLLQTNFGKGGMRALVQDYLKGHETVARESASYGARVEDEIGGSTKTSEFWASAVSTMQEGKLPREALLRTAATIRGRTGWEDPVESLSVHAYIAKSQHEALMEEKRRGNFGDTREGNSFKRQTRGDKAREAASQELPVKDTSASLGEKTTETKDKGKSIAYKLLSDIEAATNLKGVLEEHILNAKVEFTLKEVLGIAKKEFHDVIIDSIKRKRQLMSETGMSHAIDARICRDEEEVDIGYKQPTNEKNGYNQRVRFEDSSDKEMETLSHYTRKHWARATTEKRIFTKEFGSLFQGALLPNKFKQLELPTEVLSSPVEEIIKDIERITESETITLPILPPIVLLPMASGGVPSVPTGPPVPPIGPIGPAVPISVPMGQVGDRTTITLSLVRAKVWEECHYDRILNSNPTLIPTQGSSKFPNWSNLANSITGAMAPATHSTVPIQGVLNLVPLQAVPSPMASTYPQFALYQPPGINMQELPMLPGSKETNETLLLNLTKKMEELAVNMAKEKEKRPKQTNFRANVWCTNCKEQGHMGEASD